MSSQNTSTPSTNLSILSKGEHLYCIHGGYSNADPGAVALVSSQNAPEHTIIIPHEYTYVASDILLTLDCSVNICGCHLLHSLCNDPFYKPLHPPEPSALPPSSPSSGEGRGSFYTVYTGDSRVLIQRQLHLCFRKMHPNIRYNPS